MSEYFTGHHSSFPAAPILTWPRNPSRPVPSRPAHSIPFLIPFLTSRSASGCGRHAVGRTRSGQTRIVGIWSGRPPALRKCRPTGPRCPVPLDHAGPTGPPRCPLVRNGATLSAVWEWCFSGTRYEGHETAPRWDVIRGTWTCDRHVRTLHLTRYIGRPCDRNERP